jgi:hypothetical protein
MLLFSAVFTKLSELKTVYTQKLFIVSEKNGAAKYFG